MIRFRGTTARQVVKSSNELSAPGRRRVADLVLVRRKLMATPDDAKARAATAYNAAADYYDDPANSFWERFGRATVERLRLPLGAGVLDVCRGSGASAF